MIVERVRKDGSKSYQVRVSVRGKRLPAETYDVRKEARRRERDLLRLHEYNDFSRETCKSFATRWPDDYRVVKTGPTRRRRKSEKTLATYRQDLKAFIEEFGELLLIDLATDRPRARLFANAHTCSAVVARNMFQDAVNDGMVPANPFSNMQLEQSDGRKYHAPLTVDEMEGLCEVSDFLHGEWGPVLSSMIRFTYYVGPRIEEGCWLMDEWVRVPLSEVFVGKAKFDKQRTVLLLDEGAKAYRDLPTHLRPSHSRAWWSKRGKPLTPNGHWAQWSKVRDAWWLQLSAERRAELVDVDWHTLRHSTGHLFYIELGFSDEDTAAQLGHADAKLVRDLYGHGRHGALDRMKQRMLREGRLTASTLREMAA